MGKRRQFPFDWWGMGEYMYNTTKWRTTKSHVWKEFCWKSVSHFFITPCQSAHFSQENAECWRKCGCQEAHHYHVFWDCLVIQKYWSEVNKALQIVFDVPILLDFRTMYLGLKTPAMDTANGHLWSILLAAGKKAITKKWMTQTAPTIRDWADLIMDKENGKNHIRITFTTGQIWKT